MTSGQSLIIAKRGISLSKTYLAIGVFLASFGILLSALPGLLGGVGTTGVPLNATGTGGLDVSVALPLVSVVMQVFAVILFATPVLLLYVYDKNNGVLEYFLSLGMDQREIYGQYLKAALLLSSALVGFEIVGDVVLGVVQGMDRLLLLEIIGLLVVLALPVVSFETVIMMSFSSLQKQRVGSNQPLGMAIGVFMVMPAYVVPFALPSIAIQVDLLIAAVIAVLAVVTHLSSSKLIRREKLLP